jgi:G protein-coupled receptor 157
MDLGVALANLIGLSVYFDRYYYKSHHENVAAYIDGLCKTQAFFAAYSTYGSIFWTIALAAFLYFVIIHNKTKKAAYFVWMSYAICYGIPLLISMWLVLTKRLGHSPMDSSGWCSIISDNLQTGKVDIFITIFGNDLWVFLAIITIPIFYLAIRCHLANQVSRHNISIIIKISE